MSDEQKTPDGPTVSFERVQQVACAIHGEPFRAAWPKGWGVFTLTILKEALQNAVLTELLQGDLTKLPAECDRKPLCEWVGADTLRRAYVDCKVGVFRRCDVCRATGLGTPYRTKGRSFNHVCFQCVLNRFVRLH